MSGRVRQADAEEVTMAKKFPQKVTPIRPIDQEVPGDLLVDLYKKMLQVYYLEERIKTFVRAGKVSFHASTRGHEKVQIAMSYLLKPGKDWFFPYYREKALMLGLGMTPKDIFLHMLSKADDPCGGCLLYTSDAADERSS